MPDSKGRQMNVTQTRIGGGVHRIENGEEKFFAVEPRSFKWMIPLAVLLWGITWSIGQLVMGLKDEAIGAKLADIQHSIDRNAATIVDHRASAFPHPAIQRQLATINTQLTTQESALRHQDEAIEAQNQILRRIERKIDGPGR